MGAFDGKVALVTGGTSGIGKATAQRFAAEGAHVAITGRNRARGDAAAAEIGDGTIYLAADMTLADDVRKSLDRTVDAFGGLDILVNNAARSQSTLVVDMPEEEFDEVVRSVLYSTFYGTKYAAPLIEARGGGSIINIGAGSSIRPTELLGAYSAAKAGVMSFTRTSALELREKGIRVNLVSPGWIYTPIIETVRADFDKKLGMPLDDFVAKVQGRWGRPEEIADAIVHLCSEQAGFVTGVLHPVDNGLTARLF